MRWHPVAVAAVTRWLRIAATGLPWSVLSAVYEATVELQLHGVKVELTHVTLEWLAVSL